MDEIDTIGSRPQDPFYISDEDKRVMRDELFPFWEGKSVDEYCEASIVKPAYGNCPANPSFPTVLTTQ